MNTSNEQFSETNYSSTGNQTIVDNYSSWSKLDSNSQGIPHLSRKNFIPKEFFLKKQKSEESREISYSKTNSFSNSLIKKIFKENILYSYYWDQQETEQTTPASQNGLPIGLKYSCQISSSPNVSRFQDLKIREKPAQISTEKTLEKKEVQAEQQKIKENAQSNILTLTDEEIKVIISNIKTQEGSQYYQTLLRKNSEYGNKFLYPLLKIFRSELLTDQFGHNLFQQIIETLNSENFIEFLEYISTVFIKLSFSKYGAKIIQKVLDKIHFDKKIKKKLFNSIKSQIKGNVKKMCVNENASNLIQKILLLVKPSLCNFIYEEIYQNYFSIATERYGCCVIQKCLLCGNKTQKSNIINLTLQNTHSLITNKFGNYVFQCLILTSEDWVVSTVYSIISKDIFLFCKEKYSSTVIEKIFEITNRQLINEIAYCMLQNESKIIELICNQYGNYIIQKILVSVTDNNIITKTMKIIYENATKIQKTIYGARFFFKIRKIFL